MIYWVTYPGTELKPVIENLKQSSTVFSSMDMEFVHLMSYSVVKSEEDRYIFVLADGQNCIENISRKEEYSSPEEYYQRLVTIIQARQGAHYSGWADYSMGWLKHADLVLRLDDFYSNSDLWLTKLSQFFEQEIIIEKRIESIDAAATRAIKWPDKVVQFYNARVQNFPDVLGCRVDVDLNTEEWETQLQYLRETIPDNKKILLDIDKLADARYDGVRRYVKNIAVEFQKMAWQGRLPILVDVFLKKKLMTLDADTPIYDYHLGYESQLLGFKGKIKRVLPGPVYKLGRAIYLGIQVRKILAWFRDTIVERRWWMFTDENGKSLKDQLSEYKLIHCTLPQHFVYFKDLAVDKLVTLHDMTHEALPHLHREENLKWARLGHKDLSQKGAHLVSVSSNTMADFKAAYPEHRGQHRVIYEGVDLEQFGPQFETKSSRGVLDKFGVQRRSFFFTLFTLEPRKNLDTVVKSFIKFMELSDQDITLLIGGQTGWKFDSSVYSHPNIQFTGYIDEEDLPMLYGNARGFFYLSQYEGFGLPPLEAMLCGAPVVYGDNSSMSELYGDAAIGIEAFDQVSCIKAMKSLMDDAVVDEYSEKGFSQALKYNWGETARLTLQFYQELLEAQKV